ncbi:MAG TPA: type IV pilus assembly protein PilM [Verrucomicrobiae bacterium]|nr:type IV pilus assembly protein PilM [Verrucomicrobiae bacterium]
MAWFSSTPASNSYLGIDIGFGGLKMVELKNEKGRARLVTYAYANLPAESLDKSLINDIPGTAALIKQMVAKSKATAKRTVSALPISSVFSSILNVPTGNEKEIKEAVEIQAKKLVPLPLEEVSLDTKIIDKIEKGKADGKPSTRVLVTAAPKTLVTKYVEIFKQAGLDLVSLETEAFAEIRALIGKDRSTIMVIDIGSLRTNIMVVEAGIPFITRSIATGGNSITATIARTLGIPLEQAESMKRDIKSMQTFAPTGDLSPILSVLVKPILDEIRYSFNLYQGQETGGPPKRIEKIILTGGSALLPRLPEFLTQQMNVNTYLGNPWARVVYPPDLRPLLEELGPRFAVTIGCAMRDIE